MIKKECYKIKEFIRITKRLNSELGIQPLLFGSLGLQQYIAENLNPDDIDILVPDEYIKTNWLKLKEQMQFLGYDLIDVSEHKFKRFDQNSNDAIEVGFAIIESLADFANINMNNIGTAISFDAEYKFLDINQFFKVYTASMKDSYRADKNNYKDQHKIELLRKYKTFNNS